MATVRAVPIPIPGTPKSPWEIYQENMNKYKTNSQVQSQGVPQEVYDAMASRGGAPSAGGGGGAGLGAAVGAGLAGKYLLGGGASTVGATAPAAIATPALSAPSMMLPELSAVLPAGASSAAPIAASTAAPIAASTAGTAGAGALSAAAPTGLLTGASPLLYFGAPLAGLAAFSALAPKLIGPGEKVGGKIAKTLGIEGKHSINIPYEAKNAIRSQTIGRQLDRFGQLDDATKMNVVDKFRAAGALPDQMASIADPIASQATPDNASRIMVRAAYLSGLEKNRLREKYGKNWNPNVIKAGDLASILSPIGKNQIGMERYNSFQDAVKSYDDAVFNARVKEATKAKT